MITPLPFVRKPLRVEAVQITAQNIHEVAVWCSGQIAIFKKDGGEKLYVKVDVNNPKTARQSMAFIGDWVLKSESGYKVYVDRAFVREFDAELDNEPVEIPQ